MLEYLGAKIEKIFCMIVDFYKTDFSDKFFNCLKLEKLFPFKTLCDLFNQLFCQSVTL